MIAVKYQCWWELSNGSQRETVNRWAAGETIKAFLVTVLRWQHRSYSSSSPYYSCVIFLIDWLWDTLRNLRCFLLFLRFPVSHFQHPHMEFATWQSSWPSTGSQQFRVRTILALGNWVLGNICRYWVVLLLGDIFFIVTPNTIPIRQQSAPSTW